MNTDAIRAEIASALEHELKTGTLSRFVHSAFEKAAPGTDAAEITAKTQVVVDLIQGYVERTPVVIEQALAAAEREGVSEQMAPIFETALAYISEDIDFIPDEHGLAGLVDDAYVVHMLVEEMSKRHSAITGRDMLPPATFEQTQKIRQMIGEPTATRLDVAVVAFARNQNVRETIEQILEKVGQTGLAMELPSAVAFPASGTNELEIPELELGALGG